jgi:hypothetical protein
MGSERDGRAAHGAARLRENNVESPFFHGVEPERRVRIRPAAIASNEAERSVPHLPGGSARVLQPR